METNTMNIKVYGSGCPNCKKLHELTQKAVTELHLNAEVDYVTDIEKMLALGVMSSPVLTINEKIALVGQVPSLEKIKELITSNNYVAPENNKKDCACSGTC